MNQTSTAPPSWACATLRSTGPPTKTRFAPCCQRIGRPMPGDSVQGVDPRPESLMLLDTASLYFRAFFGVPPIKAPDGTPTNAVRGLLDFTARLITDRRPTHLVACLDADWRPQWRVDLIPTYKAPRVVEEVAHQGSTALH